MRLKKLEPIVRKVLENNIHARNDNFVLVLEVYKDLDIPVEFNFMGLMLEHSKYELPSFESVVRARRKVVEKFPELQATKVIEKLRKEQEQIYREFTMED